LDWALKRELQAQLAEEKGYYIYPAGTRTRVALTYPNSYFVGMSNLGLHVIYDLLNRRDDTACERAFLPERQAWQRYEHTRTPLMTVETQTPLYDFAIVAFVLSFEMDYFHMLDMLQQSKITLRAAERDERAPLIIAGGPCATFNPEPLAAVVDAFIIGEGEAIMPAFMDAYHAGRQAGEDKATLLRRLAQVPGVYVPALYTVTYQSDGTVAAVAPVAAEVPAQVTRQYVKDLDVWPAHTVVVTDNTEFNFYLIETARGCGRHCRFCMAGYCFRVPRNRSLAVVEQEVRDALPYGKKVGLMGAAISDYPEVNALSQYILGQGLQMSVASFRADSVTQELVEALAQSGLQTLTLAPEAGTSRMRAVINKGIEEEHLFHSIDLGVAAGIRNFRLYLMVGLPYEQEEDITGIIDLAERVQDYMTTKGAKGTLTLSVNPFIPKPFTPFQWLPMGERKLVTKRLKRLAQALRKRKHVIVNIESPKEAYVQGVLARGDRRVGEALLRAQALAHADTALPGHTQRGDSSKCFKRALKETGLEPAFYLYRERGTAEILPWDHLNMGFRKEYLRAELAKAETGTPTLRCFDGCHRCGVC